MSGRTIDLAIVLASCIALAGCEPSTLFLPMQPTREALAAPQRSLSDAEREAISAAVMGRLGESPRRDFKWLPLVVRPRGGAIDYCGLVGGDYLVGEYAITDANAEMRDYYARLSFDRGGKLANVNVVAIGKSRSAHIPTQVDSICVQDGYFVRP